MKPLVKICGINDLNVLNALVAMNGIDFLGFIFYENSPRNVPDDLINVINKFDFKNKRPVCVYVDADKNFVKETSSNFQNPILQFHGNETDEFCHGFSKDFWKVIKVKDNTSIRDSIKYPNASRILFENYIKGQQAGTASSFDWDLLKNVKD
mgnify:FL=1